jgi:hypothetical protein
LYHTGIRRSHFDAERRTSLATTTLLADTIASRVQANDAATINVAMPVSDFRNSSLEPVKGYRKKFFASTSKHAARVRGPRAWMSSM